MRAPVPPSSGTRAFAFRPTSRLRRDQPYHESDALQCERSLHVQSVPFADGSPFTKQRWLHVDRRKRIKELVGDLAEHDARKQPVVVLGADDLRHALLHGLLLELRQAECTEFSPADGEWRIPAKKLKMRRPHRVPLASQALTILRELQEITGGSRYLFPSVRSWHRPISDNTLNAALRRLGYDQIELTIHRLRSTASTLLNESGKWQPDAIERQLAH
ncbi:tyrosine-type recombinase/integrase [Bradyrhizobium sp. Ash2021]|uniref:tyrosine-type recombinase/integrase n=1 Tax=Bradyrhizobium sp. Ash2021 TaxID=2954771 RepID=UPI0035C06407